MSRNLKQRVGGDIELAQDPQRDAATIATAAPKAARRQPLQFTILQVALLVLFSLLAQQALLSPPPRPDRPDEAAPPLPRPPLNPLAIPAGRAPNLPSVRVAPAEEVSRAAGKMTYGGKGDKQHLGGFTEIDMHGISPAVWKHLVEKWTVHSVIDVGCGRGISTTWFAVHGLRTECVEGSHDAIEQTMVPDPSILTEHDFSRGPWWPERTFDVAWSVEFLEHVNLQFQFNYVQVFRKAAVLLVTHSNWGGWHHVEVHDDAWWIHRFEAYGFRYSDKRTQELRAIAARENHQKEEFPANGLPFNAQHVRLTMMVFINPVVAALPEHAHLFGEPGCFDGRKKKGIECRTEKKETPLDPAFYPLPLSEDQDRAWNELVRAGLGGPAPGDA